MAITESASRLAENTLLALGIMFGVALAVAIATGDGKPSRVRFEVRDGKKVRVAAKTGELING